MDQSLNLLEVEKTASLTSKTRSQHIKQIVEALLFASNEALPLEKLREVVITAYPIRSQELQKLIHELAVEYREGNRAFQIDEIAGGYLLRTSPEMRPFIDALYQDRRGEKLSQAATEVLAVIAYRGPITRREVEKIRGVDCSGTISSLIERGLIEGVGRKEVPGRPIQYATTKQFLQHFGLKDHQELIKLT